MDYGLGQPLWQGPYHPSWHLLVPGTWLIWVMPEFVKRGRLEYVQGISAVVHFEAHAEPTSIPDAYQYWTPPALGPRVLKPYSLSITEAPLRPLDAATGPALSVRQAAALRGISSKDVRRMLRAGQIRGKQVSGKWVEVDRDSLSRLPEGASPDTG